MIQATPIKAHVSTAAEFAGMQRQGVYYGWWVLGVAFAGEMLAVGSANYGYGLFVKPLTAEFGISRVFANSGLTLFIVGTGLAAPLMGRLLDRFPARVVMALGALLMGAGMAGIALSSSLLGMALCLLVPVSLGAVAIGPLAANTMAARWFERRRGVALGIVAIGTSVGGTVMVPLIGFEMQRYGWRSALLIQGGLIASVLGGLAWYVVRSRPQDLMPQYGRGSTPGVSAPADEEVWTPRSALRQRDFWCINVAVALTLAILQSMLVSLVPYATDRGFGLAQAQWMVSFMAACSIAGKLSFGAMTDRFDKRWLLLVSIGAVMVEQTTLLLAPGYRTLLLIGGIAGFASGAVLPVWASLIAERFGARSFASVMGLMNVLNVSAMVIAILFIGAVYDRTGNYALAFRLFLGVALAAGFASVLITPQPRTYLRSRP